MLDLTSPQLFSKLQPLLVAPPNNLPAVFQQADDNPWHTAIASGCETIIKDDLKEFFMCVGLNIVLRRADVRQFNEKDALHLMDALDIGIKRIPVEVLTSFRAMARLNLLILVTDIMLAIGYKGSGFKHPIADTLTWLLEQSFATEDIVKPQAWYARNLLLLMKSATQLSQEAQAAAWATVKGVMSLTKAGIGVGAMVSPIITPLALVALIPLLMSGGLGIIDGLISAHESFKKAKHLKLTYNAMIHYNIEYITKGSIALYAPISLENTDVLDIRSIEKYLKDMIMPFISNHEYYHGANTIIVKDIIDILAARLFTVSDPKVIALLFGNFLEIYNFCNKHFSRLTLHIHHSSYNGIRTYFLYNMYRLRKYAKDKGVRMLATFFKPLGDATKDKRLEEMVDRMPAIQEFYIDQDFNIRVAEVSEVFGRCEILKADCVSTRPYRFATAV